MKLLNWVLILAVAAYETGMNPFLLVLNILKNCPIGRYNNIDEDSS